MPGPRKLRGEKWREVPAVAQYPGMTELTIGGRSWQMRGVGEDVRLNLRRSVLDILSRERSDHEHP